MLSFISSQLASRPPLAPTSQPALLAPGNTSGNGGNVAAELRTHLRLWEVQWEALAILRLLGRGSFGSVYLGEWQRTLVAVKVLISKGELATTRSAGCVTVSAAAMGGALTAVTTRCLCIADKIDHGEMELPQQVMRDLQTETAVMSRMRHPK